MSTIFSRENKKQHTFAPNVQKGAQKYTNPQKRDGFSIEKHLIRYIV